MQDSIICHNPWNGASVLILLKVHAMRFAIAAVLVLTLFPTASAEEIRIVLWNASMLFDVTTIDRRAGDLRAFGQQFQDADIIVLDEVTSLAVVDAARDRMGFSDYHTACSDFSQNDNAAFNSLEVGFMSKFPLANIVEYDPSLDNTGEAGEPEEKQLVRVDVPGMADVTTPRGFLVADIPALGITIVTTHLKSSRGSAGEADHDNAMKREVVAAAMAKFVANKLREDAAATVLVAGDLNVGETDMAKNGHRLEDDCYDRRDGDLYDDTHAIFAAGLIDGLHMASLTKALGTETYDDPQFAGSGPIDCMYVVGRQAGDFTLAKRSAQTFGSDHFAVSTRFLFSGTAPPPSGGDSPPTPGKNAVHISALLPNPVGTDEGHEWVKLKNVSGDAVDLDGWQLRDEANHTVDLHGSIAPGAELTIELEDGQMPLNNSGDRIELLNNSGHPVDTVSYSGTQASPGQEIRFTR